MYKEPTNTCNELPYNVKIRIMVLTALQDSKDRGCTVSELVDKISVQDGMEDKISSSSVRTALLYHAKQGVIHKNQIKDSSNTRPVIKWYIDN